MDYSPSPGVRLLFRQLTMLQYNMPLCKPQINTYLSVVGKPCPNSAATMVKVVSAKSRHAAISVVDSMTLSIEYVFVGGVLMSFHVGKSSA